MKKRSMHKTLMKLKKAILHRQKNKHYKSKADYKRVFL